jgi:hypothetical protein
MFAPMRPSPMMPIFIFFSALQLTVVKVAASNLRYQRALPVS